MKTARIEQMAKGWFVGDFNPTLYKTGHVEVAVKSYQAGESEAAHYHKIAAEFTVITQGEVEMNGVRYRQGDIIIIEPGDITDFRAITYAMTTVVKIPGATNDKYVI